MKKLIWIVVYTVPTVLACIALYVADATHEEMQMFTQGFIDMQFTSNPDN